MSYSSLENEQYIRAVAERYIPVAAEYLQKNGTREKREIRIYQRSINRKRVS